MNYLVRKVPKYITFTSIEAQNTTLHRQLAGQKPLYTGSKKQLG
jgi:hypothetical protein